jgi:hypothetical protein
MIPKKFIDIPLIERYYRIDEDGAIFSLRKQRYLKPTYNSAGYLFVYIRIDNEPMSSRFYGVHRLVATKYIGQCPEHLETSHKDGSRQNNHASNLEYISHSDNIKKSFSEHGRKSYIHNYPRKPHTDATKEAMSNAKKKAVVLTLTAGEVVIYPSIEDAAQSLHTYRKKIYRSIKEQSPYKDKHNPSIKGFMSFFNQNCPV